MITSVSFKRKIRDLVLRKDEPVWKKVAKELGIHDRADDFDILERRGISRSEVNTQLNSNFKGFKKKYWDARIFGNTFLEEGVGDTIRAGIVHFGLAVSVSPIRVHRLTQTKLAPAEGGKAGEQGPSRGMAPLAHRVVEHGLYGMPFFVNPTGAQGERGTGCTALDIVLLLKLIRYAYSHTKSDIRPLVEVRRAWYAEHDDDLGSFSEFEFIEKLMPKRKGGDSEKPSVSGTSLEEQYAVPTELPKNGDLAFRGRMKNDRLYDVCFELPEWCNQINRTSGNGRESSSGT
jgi:Cas7 group CRISPR-associated protein Csh2